MRRTEGDAFGINVLAFLQAARDFVANRGRNASVIHGDEDGGSILVAAEGEGFGPDLLGDTFRFFFSDGISAQANWVMGGDIDTGDACQDGL